MTQQEIGHKFDLLVEWIKASHDYVDSKTKTNRKYSVIFRVVAISASTIATILLGVKGSGDAQEIVVNIAFALTAAVTLVNAFEPIFNFRGLWIQHERAEAGFKMLLDDLRFFLSGKEPANLDYKSVEEFYDRYKGVWQGLNDAWQRERHAGEPAFRSARSKIEAGADMG